jgi:hypothetical protein
VLNQLLVNGTGTPGRLAKFTTTTDIGDSLLSEDGGRINVGGGVDFTSDFSFIGNAEPAATGRVQMFDRAWQGFVIRGLNIIFETLQGTPAVPTEALRITQTGNIGIGTTNPSEQLEVEGKVKATQFMGDGSQLSGVAALSATNAFSGQGMFTAAPTGSSVNQGSLFVNPAAAAAGSTVLGLAVGGTQRFMVDAEGDVTVAGDLTAASLSEISARKWKTNIQPLVGAIGKVERLRGVSYDLRTSGRHDIGFIAEEVGEVVPEVVVRGENGETKSVNYSRLTALLVEAVKEQQAQIRELQSEIQLLKAKLKGEGQASPVK